MTKKIDNKQNNSDHKPNASELNRDELAKVAGGGGFPVGGSWQFWYTRPSSGGDY